MAADRFVQFPQLEEAVAKPVIHQAQRHFLPRCFGEFSVVLIQRYGLFEGLNLLRIKRAMEREEILLLGPRAAVTQRHICGLKVWSNPREQRAPAEQRREEGPWPGVTTGRRLHYQQLLEGRASQYLRLDVLLAQQCDNAEHRDILEGGDAGGALVGRFDAYDFTGLVRIHSVKNQSEFRDFFVRFSQLDNLALIGVV